MSMYMIFIVVFEGGRKRLCSCDMVKEKNSISVVHRSYRSAIFFLLWMKNQVICEYFIKTAKCLIISHKTDIILVYG